MTPRPGAALARRDEIRPLLTRRIDAAGDQPGLVGWWSFDEPAGTPVAFDISGHRLGGELVDLERAPGVVGTALACAGGAVVVPDEVRLFTRTLSADEVRICWQAGAQPAPR